MANFHDLQIRQLDALLVPIQSQRERTTPPQGWIRTIRKALGMSLRQLAERTELSKNAVTSAELNEAKGTIQLNSLRRLADAMDCELVYHIVPRTSLQQFTESQAWTSAQSLVSRVSDSMELESQSITRRESNLQIEELAQELLRTRGQDFWNV